MTPRDGYFVGGRQDWRGPWSVLRRRPRRDQPCHLLKTIDGTLVRMRSGLYRPRCCGWHGTGGHQTLLRTCTVPRLGHQRYVTPMVVEATAAGGGVCVVGGVAASTGCLTTLPRRLYPFAPGDRGGVGGATVRRLGETAVPRPSQTLLSLRPSETRHRGGVRSDCLPLRRSCRRPPRVSPAEGGDRGGG